MANPQRENGFTPIAHEILESIQQYKFSLNEIKIILCVFRFTYGFNRKTHEMSLSYIANHTGLNRSRVNDSIKNLVKNNVLFITQKGDAKTPNSYMFNKNYQKWSVEKYAMFEGSTESDTSTENDTGTSVQNRTSTSVRFRAQERKVKERLKKDEDRPNAFTFYQQNFGVANPVVLQSIDMWINDMSEELVIEAMITGLKNNARSFSYCETILKNWYNEGIRTMQDLEAQQTKKKFPNVTPFTRKKDNLQMLDEIARKLGYREDAK